MTYKPTFIDSAATTVCRSTAGSVHTVTVTGGTAGTITGYDNASVASGTKVFEFGSTNAIQTYTFDATLVNGLVVVTSAATKLTVTTGTPAF